MSGVATSIFAPAARRFVPLMMIMAVAAGISSGCQVAPTATGARTTAGQPESIIVELRPALVDKDSARWRRLIDPAARQAASTRTQLQLLYDNLTALDIRSITTTGQTPAPAGQERGTPPSTIVQTEVTWSVTGWTGQHTSALRLIVAETGDGPRLAAVAPASAGYRPPAWATESVRPAARGSVAVLAAGAPEPWLAAAARVPGEVPLLIIVPVGANGFARLAGDDESTTTAALTVADLPARGRQFQVIVNPTVTTELTAAGRGVLITHEAIHVSTASPLTDSPLWVEEGYAEWRAQRAWPETTGQMDTSLGEQVRQRRDLPSGLPADRDFAGAAGIPGGLGPDAALAYGRALLAWRVIGGSGGDAEPRADRVYTELISGRPLPQALSSVGLDSADLKSQIDDRLAQLR